MLKLILGKSGTGKSTKLYSYIKENLSNGKIFLIVPEQSNLSAEKNLIDFLNQKALLNVEVLTLSRMADRVLTGEGSTLEMLNDSSKAMIINDILRREKDNLKFLGKSDKNVGIISNLITELKKHNISVSDFCNLDINDELTKIKIEDIKIIFRDYCERVSNGFIDDNDKLSLITGKIEESQLFEDAIVCIDDFNGFTPQEIKAFEEILKSAKDVVVSVSSDGLEVLDKQQDIFYFNKIFINKLINICLKNGIKYETDILKENLKTQSEELIYLEKLLSQIEYLKPYEKEVNDIKLFLANNTYSEIEHVANEILKIVKDEKYHYNEIAVISGNISDYDSEIKVIFDKYDIPVFIDEKKDLSQNILIKYILSILEIYAKNWSFESVFNYIKLGMHKIPNEDVYLLENYCKKWGIKNYKWLQSFSYEPKNDIQDNLELVRIQIVEPLLALKESISKNKTAKEISKQIYEFLINNEINIILDEKLKQIDSIEITNEYNTSYKILIDVLDNIALLFGDNKISFENYKELIQIGFTYSELGKIPVTQDQVTFGDSKRSINSNIKVCFIVGMNDGKFPLINRFEGFLNDKDRDILKENNIELAKNSIDSMYENNFEIYNTFCLATKKIYLSYVSQDKDGKAERPSILIKKIKKVFPKIIEDSDIINKKYYITNEKATYDDSISVYRQYLDTANISDEWKLALNYYFNTDKSRLEGTLKALNYTNMSEEIDSKFIEKLYGKRLKTSISRLEQYRRCPFSFHMKYGLKLKEKEDLKLKSIDTGTFMHEVIDSFFETIDSQEIDINEIDDNKIKKIIEEILDEYLQTSKYYIFSSTPKFKTLTKKLRNLVFESMQYIIYTMKNSNFNVLGHEIEFSDNGKYKPIVLDLDNGQKVEIVGKIDRVDIGKLDDKTYVRIVDYKSSIKNIDMNQVEAGLQIQLITYLDAISKQEDFSPSGILYLGLTDNKVIGKRNLSKEEIEKEIRKKFRMNGVILANVNVVKMMDKTLEPGKTSDIIPVGLKQDGEFNIQKSSVLNEEEFDKLQKTVNTTIKDITREILSGKISINPYNYKKQTACDYCEYKSICMFNTNLKDNKYNYIK